MKYLYLVATYKALMEEGLPVLLIENLEPNEGKALVCKGIAGFKANEIAPLFTKAIGLENILLPEDFVAEIER